ncbi:289_t:CDS:2 [Ambispora gerdemannii]|uniref:289_t:CDS:1 n=1 Tax=Ambispora gerdemannii TaxID=144530 RepID=A0A9N9CYT9_9GLOM|nr:289_t:CDS:2 [Ambispora gerdemannii]
MYIPKLSLLLFILISSTAIIDITEAQLKGKWPPKGPPPINKAWNKLVKKKKLVNAPVITTQGDCSGNPIDTCNWSCSHCNRPDDILACPTKNVWGLSFDDGPSEYTSALLDFLDENDVKATFFLIGINVVGNPELVKRMVDSGHEVGVHTWSHTALTTQTTEQIIAEVKWTEKAIKEAGGITPRLMRPPFGDMDDRVRGIMKQLGYKIVIWDKDSRDWVSVSDPTFQLEWVAGNFSVWASEDTPTGHISLEHDYYQQTAEQGPKAVSTLLDAGWNINTVANCSDFSPYLENLKGGDETAAASEVSLNNNATANNNDNTTDPTVVTQSATNGSFTSKISTISLVVSLSIIGITMSYLL